MKTLTTFSLTLYKRSAPIDVEQKSLDKWNALFPHKNIHSLLQSRASERSVTVLRIGRTVRRGHQYDGARVMYIRDLPQDIAQVIFFLCYAFLSRLRIKHKLQTEVSPVKHKVHLRVLSFLRIYL